MLRVGLLLATISVAACYSDIYVRDGVTSGNRFHIGAQTLLSDDAVEQSWISYSLNKSICQLEIGGDNPARANSFGCEFSSRLMLLDTWEEKRVEDPQLHDDYLDTLAKVREAAFLDEYVVHYFGKKTWLIPAEIDEQAFYKWRRKHLRGHAPYTRIVGSWGYK